MAGADLNSKNLSMNTPLHSAVETGQVDVVKYLLKQKDVKLNEQNCYGQTPKAIATVLRQVEILEMLQHAKGEDVPL